MNSSANLSTSASQNLSTVTWSLIVRIAVMKLDVVSKIRIACVLRFNNNLLFPVIKIPCLISSKTCNSYSTASNGNG